MAVDPREWAERFRTLSDDSKAIQSMGKYFTVSYMLDMGDRKIIVEMHDGKVKNINIEPAPLDAYDFALRASAECWRKMSVAMPEPMYHGIWAASFRKGLTMEGNLLALMQNMRNIMLQIELLRETGAPV